MLAISAKHMVHFCDSNLHNVQARSFKRGKDSTFLPKPMADEKAYTSEALTSSLGLYKQKFPDAAAAGVTDDLLTIMQQVRVCSSL